MCIYIYIYGYIYICIYIYIYIYVARAARSPLVTLGYDYVKPIVILEAVGDHAVSHCSSQGKRRKHVKLVETEYGAERSNRRVLKHAEINQTRLGKKSSSMIILQNKARLQ